MRSLDLDIKHLSQNSGSNNAHLLFGSGCPFYPWCPELQSSNGSILSIHTRIHAHPSNRGRRGQLDHEDPFLSLSWNHSPSHSCFNKANLFAASFALQCNCSRDHYCYRLLPLFTTPNKDCCQCSDSTIVSVYSICEDSHSLFIIFS